MALGTTAKIFKKDREVWVAKFVDTRYAPKIFRVDHISKGRVHVVNSHGDKLDFSPNDRKLCLTGEECSAICRIINSAIID